MINGLEDQLLVFLTLAVLHRFYCPAIVVMTNFHLSSYVTVTSARDKVILNPESARPKWGKPGETILNVLQGVPLAEGTMASNTSGQFSTCYLYHLLAC